MGETIFLINEILIEFILSNIEFKNKQEKEDHKRDTIKELFLMIAFIYSNKY